jgi:hypothetical protein
MKAGRVTRKAMVCGSWQSMQATGWEASFRASAYGILLMASNPLTTSPSPAFRYGTDIEAWQLRQVPGCAVTCWRSVNVWSSSMYACPRSSRKSFAKA